MRSSLSICPVGYFCARTSNSFNLDSPNSSPRRMGIGGGFGEEQWNCGGRGGHFGVVPQTDVGGGREQCRERRQQHGGFAGLQRISGRGDDLQQEHAGDHVELPAGGVRGQRLDGRRDERAEIPREAQKSWIIHAQYALNNGCGWNIYHDSYFRNDGPARLVGDAEDGHGSNTSWPTDSVDHVDAGGGAGRMGDGGSHGEEQRGGGGRGGHFGVVPGADGGGGHEQRGRRGRQHGGFAGLQRISGRGDDLQQEHAGDHVELPAGGVRGQRLGGRRDERAEVPGEAEERGQLHGQYPFGDGGGRILHQRAFVGDDGPAGLVGDAADGRGDGAGAKASDR